MTINRKLKAWMSAASLEQKERLARLANTSVSMLYHLSSGERKASSEKAIRIERAAAKIGGGLPTLSRMDLNATCRGCEYAKACNSKEKLW
jgi:hypothetical protein